MTEFHDHGGPVNDVEFHPHEFLLASASADRTVNFWDLENFNLVSKSERDTGPVRYVNYSFPFFNYVLMYLFVCSYVSATNVTIKKVFEIDKNVELCCYTFFVAYF